MPRRPRCPWPTAIIVVAAGCVSLPPPQAQPDAAVDIDAPDGCRDDDGDGYAACGVARVDCDDGNAAIHPGALELCVGGVDEDCQGDAELDCDDRLSGNRTSDAGVDPWRVTNDALVLSFDRGPTADGTAGAISLLDLAGSDSELLTTSLLSLERYTGTARWDTAVSWRSAPVFEDLANGAAVVRLRQRWADDTVSGAATYTIYPDGRIHRHDEVLVEAASDNRYLTSFIVLDPDAIDRADWEGRTEPAVILDLPVAGGTYRAHYQGEAGGPRWACGFHAGRGDRLGFAFLEPPGARGLRVAEANRFGDVHLTSFSFDWVREDRVVPVGPYAVDVMFHVGHSVAADPCAGFEVHAEAFLAPPFPTVAAPSSVGRGAPYDRNGDGYGEQLGAYWVEAVGRNVTFSVDAPVPSPALRITGVSGAFDPVVFLDGTALVRGRDYHLQHEPDDGGTYWVFLAVPLPASTPLLFEWP